MLSPRRFLLCLITLTLLPVMLITQLTTVSINGNTS